MNFVVSRFSWFHRFRGFTRFLVSRVSLFHSWVSSFHSFTHKFHGFTGIIGFVVSQVSWFLGFTWLYGFRSISGFPFSGFRDFVVS